MRRRAGVLVLVPVTPLALLVAVPDGLAGALLGAAKKPLPLVVWDVAGTVGAEGDGMADSSGPHVAPHPVHVLR